MPPRRPGPSRRPSPYPTPSLLTSSADIRRPPLPLAWRLPVSWGPLQASLLRSRIPLWFLITRTMKSSCCSRARGYSLKQALLPWEPLQFFESSLAAGLPLRSLSYFFFSRVCSYAEDSGQLCGVSPLLPCRSPDPIRIFKLGSKCLYLLSHLILHSSEGCHPTMTCWVRLADADSHM